MKRDVDLARQLLLDIENHGADCSVSVLRTGPNHEAEERVRYHLRLLIDAGFLKEIERAANGVPCVRLTDAGHELIELARDEPRWRDAKWECQERTGGLSLGVVRALLWRWALEAPRRRPQRRYDEAAPAVGEGRYRGRRSAYRFDPYVDQAFPLAAEDDVHYVRVRPAYRNGWQLTGVDVNGGNADELDLAPALPDYLI